ncbi:unnamed protein product, partial [Symbiodinium necroappetens]
MASRERPPSPVDRPSDCVEIPHRLELHQDDDVAILVNHISGERVVLETRTDDNKVHYSPDQRHGFVVMNGKSVWARLFKWHAFECRRSREPFLVHRLSQSAGLVLQWLDEGIGRTWRKLTLPEQVEPVVTLEFDRPYRSSGCCIFWSLQSLLKSFLPPQTVTQSKISTWMRKSWRKVLQSHLGRGVVMDDHILTTDRQAAASSSVGQADAVVLDSDDVAVDPADAVVADHPPAAAALAERDALLLQVDITMLSTVAALQLLLHMCNKPPQECSEETVRQFSRSLMAFFHVGQKSTRSVDHSEYLSLVFEKEYNPSMGRSCGEPLFNVSGNLAFDRVDKSCNWKELSRQEKKSVSLHNNADILALLWSTQRKSNCQWICDQLCFQVAQVVEAGRFLVFHKSFVVLTQSESGSTIKPRRSLSDPAVLAHRARQGLKESGKKSKKKRKKGEAKSNPRAMDDKKDLVRYFYGCRRAMADTKVLAIA